MTNQQQIGKLVWLDLTVERADEISDFYSKVVGWVPEPVSMGEYSDYNMVSPTNGESITGICHQRGVNADIPAMWLPWIVVDDIQESVEACQKLGGSLLRPVWNDGSGSYVIIQDPVGVITALFQSNSSNLGK